MFINNTYTLYICVYEFKKHIYINIYYARYYITYHCIYLYRL